MKKSFKFVLLTFLFSPTAHANFCINVSSDNNFFDQKGNLSSATFAFEFEQAGQTQELEVKVSKDKPSSTICTPEEKKSRKLSLKKSNPSQVSKVSNIRATLTVTDKSGKSEGIQCGTKGMSVDREYLPGMYDIEQVNVTLLREDLHTYQMKPGQRRASNERCELSIVQKSKKK